VGRTAHSGVDRLEASDMCGADGPAGLKAGEQICCGWLTVVGGRCGQPEVRGRRLTSIEGRPSGRYRATVSAATKRSN
jgi:hypothetical protein